MGSAFLPHQATVNVSATTSSTSVALPVTSESPTIRVYNSANAVAFIDFGNTSATASSATSLPIAPGAVEVVTIFGKIGTAAAVLARGTGSVYFTIGEGI